MKSLHLATATLAIALAPAFALAAGPNDAQIAAIVVTANQVDIDAGAYAESHAGGDDVKAFARQMVTDHTAVNKSATDLAGKLHLAPEDNATAQSLKKGGDDNVAHLKTLSGPAASSGARRCRRRPS